MSTPVPSMSPGLTGWVSVMSRDIAALADVATDGGRTQPSPSEKLTVKAAVAEKAANYADGWFGADADAVRPCLVGASWTAAGETISALTGLVALGGNAAQDIPDLPGWVARRLYSELGQSQPRQAGGAAA